MEEVKTLNQLLRGRNPPALRGRAGQRERVPRADRGPTILHFGGHGVFIPKGYRRVAVESLRDTRGFAQAAGEKPAAAPPSPDLPLMHTALLVAPAGPSDQETYDNLATSYEIARMELGGTELVVLSACDTANGIDIGSQGTASLRRAFMMAGAKTVLATLWPMSDGSTAALMAEFYGRSEGHGAQPGAPRSEEGDPQEVPRPAALVRVHPGRRHRTAARFCRRMPRRRGSAGWLCDRAESGTAFLY